MLLYILKDGTAKHVMENPSVTDILAVSLGLLKIYKFDIHKERFLTLIKDEDSIEWVAVREAKVVSHKECRLHL